MARMLAWVGMALGAAYLVFIGGGWLGIYTAGLRIATVSLAAVVLGGWAFVAWRRPEWRPRSVLLPAILACLASLAISTAFSRVPRVSLEYLGYGILLAALYLLLVRLMADPFFRSRLVGLGSVLFVAVAVEFIVYVVFLWIQWWQAVGHLAIPPLRPNFIGLAYGNPSAVLTMVALLAVPTAARWASWRPRGIVTFLAIGVVTGVVALMTGSRAGWLALGVAGLVGVVALVASRERRGSIRRAMRGDGEGSLPRVLWRGLPVLGIAAVAVGVILLPAILRRAEAGGEDLRGTFYAVALRMFAASPVVGTGPGTWVIQRTAFTQTNEIDVYIPHAHDVPVQTLAELGLVGAAAGVILIGSLVWLFRNAARSADGERQRWGWLTGLGLLYFGVHNLLDFYPNMPAVLFAAALPVAYLDATSPAGFALPRLVRSRPIGPRTSLAGLAVVVFAAAALLLQEGPVLQLADAVGAANTGKWEQALAPARAAAAADPDISPYQLTAGLVSAHLGDHAAAAAYFQRVADRDDLPEAWLDLAAEQAELGRRDEAVAALDRAFRLGWQRAEVAMPAGALALRLGLIDLATEAFADSIVRSPSLAGDPWWMADPERTALYPSVIEAALDLASPDARWQIAMLSGDEARATDLAADAPSPQRAGLIIAAGSGSPEAIRALDDACAANPLDLGQIRWCARIANRSGNDVEADRFRTQAETINAGSSAGGLELRVATPEDRGPILAPAGAYTWAVYTYRRWGPLDMLVPALVHLHLE
jgi:O-antigen ligase